jgi:hypothetical protein
VHAASLGPVHHSRFSLTCNSLQLLLSIAYYICHSGFSSAQLKLYGAIFFGQVIAMEVFGTISSAISILDVVIRSSNAIHELICEWRDAPVEIIALANEVNDSKAVLTQARNLVQRIEAAPAAQSDLSSCSVAIEKQVEQAKPIWNKLHRLLNEFKDEDNAVDKLTKTVKFRWLKNRSKAESLRTALKEKRLNIMQFMISSSA